MSRLYVYAVIRAEDQRAVDLPAVADATAPVHCLQIGSVAAVVSPTSAEEILSTRRNMLSHTKILEELNRDRPLLPFRFGMIAENVARLRSILLAREAELLTALGQLQDTIEVGLRATFVEADVFRDIVAESPELKRQSALIKDKPPAQTYYERIEIGRQIGQHLATRKAAVAAQIAARLGAFAQKAVLHPTTEDLHVFNAAYLVRRSDEPALFAEVERIETEMRGKLVMRYVAPAPPYNFVSIKLDSMPLAA